MSYPFQTIVSDDDNELTLTNSHEIVMEEPEEEPEEEPSEEEPSEEEPSETDSLNPQPASSPRSPLEIPSFTNFDNPLH